MIHRWEQTRSAEPTSGRGDAVVSTRSEDTTRSADSLRRFVRRVSDPCEAPPARLPSGLAQLDDALGGGFAVGALYLLPGRAGGGKSTLAFAIAGAALRRGHPALYVCTERATREVQLEAKRVGAPGDLAVIGADHIESIRDVETLAADQHPHLLVVDSLHSSAGYAAGGVGSAAKQVDAAHRLAALAREHDCSVLALGQVTKAGEFLGRSEIAHIVDAVIDLEWDEGTGLRVLTVGKNRFGPSGGQVLFELGGAGVIPVGRHLNAVPTAADVLPLSEVSGQRGASVVASDWESCDDQV